MEKLSSSFGREWGCGKLLKADGFPGKLNSNLFPRQPYFSEESSTGRMIFNDSSVKISLLQIGSKKVVERTGVVSLIRFCAYATDSDKELSDGLHILQES